MVSYGLQIFPNETALFWNSEFEAIFGVQEQMSFLGEAQK